MLVIELHILQYMTLDTTIKVTDLITIGALIIGPILAVQITEFLRKQEAERRRRVHIFRTLMATRRTNLDPKHVEALNLVEFEFRPRGHRKVVDSLKLYIVHLNTPWEAQFWESRRNELLAKLLYEMSECLGYNYDQAQIQTGAYSPSGWTTTSGENEEQRKLWLEVLRGQRTLNCFNAPQSQPRPAAPPKT